MLDAFVHRLARLALAVFFRHRQLDDRQHLPTRGPALVVANHVNSLIDAVLVAGTLPAMPRFLAKSTLWEVAFLRPFLRLARVIPVYRRQDPGVDLALNEGTFARCHEVLRDGGIIALFPEGISHNEPELQPLRTGAARIALEAEERFGPLETRIVPLGLTFDAKGTFRSSALVKVGEALTPRLAAGEDPREAARRLTAEIDQALRAATLNFESWEEARRLRRAAELFARPDPAVPRRASLAEAQGLQRLFLEGSRSLRLAYPQRVERAEKAVDRYDRLLAATGLRDDQVGSRYPPAKVLRYALGSLLTLLLGLPLAVVGSLLNWPPYRLTGRIARRFARSPDVESTYKLFPALGIFPLCWLLEGLAAGWLGGWLAALAVTFVAPPAGWLALRFHERRRSFFEEARAYLKLRTARRMAAALRELRAEVLAAVKDLIEVYRQDAPSAAAPGTG